ncbi:hypothetical protein [Streptomyces sp. NBC_01744]|uniref:hypothetical protein n=1 Tax=Streptomyces sp. NBC_01744 TaxID=2975927 RepID=UPI003D9A286E|nr:hypothetical protein OIE70_36680 [Streptomyces sp. NBC_01744]
MRATIRRTNLDVLHGDVDAAMPQLEIEDHAMYYQLLVIAQPGEPDSIGEDVIPGSAVRELIRTQLQVAMHEVEQTDRDEITLRWTRKSKRNNYRTQSCTYSKVC